MNKWNTYITGRDGNAFAIMGETTTAMRKAGATPEDISAYRKEATSGDYNHLLETTMLMVDIRLDEELDEEICEGCGDTLLWCDGDCLD